MPGDAHTIHHERHVIQSEGRSEGHSEGHSESESTYDYAAVLPRW